jgi:hypothetical protein
MAKMNNGATPSGSRGGTPNPSQDVGDDDDDDAALSSSKSKGDLLGAGSGGVRKKLLKKGLKDKAKKEGVGGTPATGKIPKSLAPPSRSNGARSSPAPSGTGDGKRDRDDDGGDEDDEDEVHVKKRQKLQRVASTTSTATAPEMERGESNDGSFVGDGGSFVDDD